MIKRNFKIMAALAIIASISTGFTTVNAASISNNTTKAAYATNANSKEGNSGDFLKTQLDALVTSGTITSTEETAIETALTPQDKGNGGNHNDRIKTALDALVTAGTITSAQETAIETALTPQNNGNSGNHNDRNHANKMNAQSNNFRQ